MRQRPILNDGDYLRLKPFHDKKWRKKILDINVEDIKAFKIVEEFKAAREKKPQVSTMPYVPCRSSTMQLTFCSSNWRVKCIKKMNSFPAAYWRGLGFSLQFLFASPFSLGRQKMQVFFNAESWSFFAHSIIKRLCLVWWSSSLSFRLFPTTTTSCNAF